MTPFSHVAWRLLLGCAFAAALVFLLVAGQRIFYPHELEWMEGAMVDHSARVADGLPLYCAPGPEHVPFLYAPLMFWLGGFAMKLGLPGLLALRLVATAATAGTTMIIGHWVRRETGKLLPGLVAMGVFLGGYGWFAWWYDLARNDTLFVLPCLCTAYVLRHGTSRRWLPAAVLATTAVLAKQSALMWLPAILIGALCHDWRNALRFGAATLGGIAAATGLMHWASDGWSTFFLFEMPRHHGWNGERKLLFWTEDLRPMWPLVALGLLGFVLQWRAGQRREALFLAAVGCGGVVTSWFSRLHVGGFDNVLLYGFAGACVLGPAAAAAANTRWLQVSVPFLLLVQFVSLGLAATRPSSENGRWPRTTRYPMLPSPAHRRAHEELLAFVKSQPGPVWIPGHGGISGQAGKGTSAHGQAIFDLMQLLPRKPDGTFDLATLDDRSKLAHLSERARRALASLLDGTAVALREKRFAAIVVDSVGAHAFEALFNAGLAGADGQRGTADDPYVRLPGPLLTEPRAISPLFGYEVHSPYALVPRR
ncbi:MAG TPA: hypothetical protein VFD82_15895 [Planctomycetota bacterium]|nr:hypothetical protein [Planctomycetota bacterium]